MAKWIALSSVVALLLGAAAGYLLIPLWSPSFNESKPVATMQGGEEDAAGQPSPPSDPEIAEPSSSVTAAGSEGSSEIATSHTSNHDGSEPAEPLFYRHPMNPEITSPIPKKDEMGMDFVPVYADGDVEEVPGTVTIDPVIVQNIGVRTAIAERRSISRTIQALGRVDYDEEKLTRLHPKTDGWIEGLRVSTTGQLVERGDVLLSLYSPQLVTSQQEYLLAVKNLEVLADSPYEDVRRGAEELVVISRQRLELLDVPDHQVRELEKDGEIKKNLHIHSPFKGVVLNVGARDGEYVTPTTELYQIADLSKVWVYVDVYEQEIPWVRVGDVGRMEVTSLPGRVFEGRINYIYPYLERDTRTVKVRIEFDNHDLALKPEMFANVTLSSQQRPDAVVIPEEAVIRSGTGERVLIVRGPGKFELREVKLGFGADGMVEIAEGVEPGDEVVTSAQFLIDSESKLREAMRKMLESPSAEDSARTDGGSQPSTGSGTGSPSADHSSEHTDGHE